MGSLGTPSVIGLKRDGGGGPEAVPTKPENTATRLSGGRFLTACDVHSLWLLKVGAPIWAYLVCVCTFVVFASCYQRTLLFWSNSILECLTVHDGSLGPDVADNVVVHALSNSGLNAMSYQGVS